MATQLKIEYNDICEYVKNMVELGEKETMAEYQARYYEAHTSKSVKDAIADLHLERFATKEDLVAVEHRLDAKIDRVTFQLEEKINKVAHDLEKFKISIEKYIENKFFKHTTITVLAIILNDIAMSDSLKHMLASMLHVG